MKKMPLLISGPSLNEKSIESLAATDIPFASWDDLYNLYREQRKYASTEDRIDDTLRRRCGRFVTQHPNSCTVKNSQVETSYNLPNLFREWLKNADILNTDGIPSIPTWEVRYSAYLALCVARFFDEEKYHYEQYEPIIMWVGPEELVEWISDLINFLESDKSRLPTSLAVSRNDFIESAVKHDMFLPFPPQDYNDIELEEVFGSKTDFNGIHNACFSLAISRFSQDK